MGGAIGVVSSLGKGSVFWFTVRLRISSSPESTMGTSHRLVNMRALLVDGNAASGQFIHEQMVNWKMRNGIATTGAEALRLLQRAAKDGDPYPLAIVDQQMPDIDGLALARKIKADPTISNIRLILLSNFGKRFSAQELQDSGFTDCCFKPVRQSNLFDCLANALGGIPEKFARLPAEQLASPDLGRRPQEARVLIADDNSVNRMVALGLLKRLGYSADTASNGQEVLDALEQTQYDIILMDCQMPEVDGYEATRRIRARNGGFSQPYIIAMTAHAMIGDREKCLAAGMDEYVSKPVISETLATALARGTERIIDRSSTLALASEQPL
jgi:CheY-like chemotaxis protein